MLDLMYITNNPDIAKIAQNAGVDIIFVDMEYIGKDDRQKNKDTVKNAHTFSDIKNIKSVLTSSQLLVRTNVWHDKSAEYCSSEDEIKKAIEAGADILMLPFYKSLNEVENFIHSVDGQAKVMLLLETSEAIDILDDVLKIKEVNSIHIGLNDLSICIGRKFLFELLSDGTVESICDVLSKTDLKYGFGGIANLGSGLLPSEYIIKEHYRLGSSIAILSRTFCDTRKIQDLNEIENVFDVELKKIRKLEAECLNASDDYFIENKKQLDDKINLIKQGVS